MWRTNYNKQFASIVIPGSSLIRFSNPVARLTEKSVRQYKT
jgi:hypothetical protein